MYCWTREGGLIGLTMIGVDVARLLSDCYYCDGMERLGWVRNDATVVEECVVMDAKVAHPMH
jgi:hypothetical protein